MRRSLLNFKGICRIGIPTAIQGMAYCGISMILTRMVSDIVRRQWQQRVGGQIESISWNTADGFAAALNAFVAQNYGAGERTRPERISGILVDGRNLGSAGLRRIYLFPKCDRGYLLS